MKETAVLIIVLIGGILMIAQYFLNIPFLNSLYKKILDWSIVISIFALVIAIRSLLARQFKAIRERTEHIVLPLTTIVSFSAVVIIGLIWGVGEGGFVDTVYKKFLVPMQAAIFSLLAFYIASASYRAFRAKNFSSIVLLAAASIVIIGRIPLGDALADMTTVTLKSGPFALIDFPRWAEWILNVPNVGIKRAFAFGITIGIVFTSLKVIFGIERGYLK